MGEKRRLRPPCGADGKTLEAHGRPEVYAAIARGGFSFAKKNIAIANCSGRDAGPPGAGRDCDIISRDKKMRGLPLAFKLEADAAHLGAGAAHPGLGRGDS